MQERLAASLMQAERHVLRGASRRGSAPGGVFAEWADILL